MASQVFFTLKSCFSFIDGRLSSEFLHRTMFRYGNILGVTLCKFMLSVFWFISNYVSRRVADHKSPEDEAGFITSRSQEDGKVVSESSMDFFSAVAREEEVSIFSFSLFRQDSKDSKENSTETEDSAFVRTDFSPSVFKYQFMPGNNVLGYMDKPQTMNFTIQEMFVDSIGATINTQNIDGRVSKYEDLEDHHRYSNASSDGEVVSWKSGVSISDSKIEGLKIEEGTPEQESADFSVKNPLATEILEEEQASTSPQDNNPIDEEIDDDISYEVQLLPRNEFSTSDSMSDLRSSSDGMIEVPCSNAKPYEILVSNSSVIPDHLKPDSIEKSETREEVIAGNLCTIRESSVNEDTQEDVDDEYIELKPCLSEDVDDEYIELKPCLSDANEVIEESLSEKDENLFDVAYNEWKESELMDEGSRGCQVFEGQSFVKGSLDSDSDDEDEFDILLEHQQLVKQMKMEKKNSKLRGLPTISEEEECETPKVFENLKPLKIEEKFEFKDLMEEIKKFCKTYTEKMRKLDILNYQSLHAISFLQLKESQLFMPSKKSLVSFIKPFALPSFTLFKQQRIYADPTLKSINELHRDLELVYVGQACLSWETLRWQYGKVKELIQHGSQDSHSYNQVAGEYQQFQVLLQRFLEDERFEGPRIQHYVKSRCFFRGLLQVPCIKGDCSENKKEIIGEEVDAISITMLAETIKASMQIFWEFIRADKEAASGVLKSLQGYPGDIQSPADSQLLMNVRTCLEKKERKIKEIQRSGNCIVKKFQRHQGSPSNALLISQVELKLVSRVMSMSRLRTDHLIWCQKKLNNINIVNRKVGFEPAFLLFPC